MTVQGRRQNPPLLPGDYGRNHNQVWEFIMPETAVVETLTDDQVCENNDLTVTVAPSVNLGGGSWYIVCGEWRST